MSSYSEFQFPSSDGLHRCQGYLWQPAGAARGVVQIVHGITEHLGRYDHFARFLTRNGYVVCGHDHLGHGRTAQADGSFGVLPARGGWAKLAADVRRLRQGMGARFPGLPYILLGHSMGSFLVRTYLCRWPGTVDGAILSGTGQEKGALVASGKALAALIGRARGQEKVSPLVHQLSLGAYNRQFAPNRTSADWTCADEGQVDRYLADPFCTFLPTVGLYREMLGGLQYISSPEALARMDPDTPVYLFSGGEDPVGANGKGVRKVVGYFARQGTRDLTWKLYPKGRHEMLNEANREEVYADVLAWLEEHTGGNSLK